MWPFVKQLLQSSLLFWELVIDLPDVNRLQIWVTVAWVGLANMHKQVLVELERQKCKSGDEHSVNSLSQDIRDIFFLDFLLNTFTL